MYSARAAPPNGTVGDGPRTRAVRDFPRPFLLLKTVPWALTRSAGRWGEPAYIRFRHSLEAVPAPGPAPRLAA